MKIPPMCGYDNRFLMVGFCGDKKVAEEIDVVDMKNIVF